MDKQVPYSIVYNTASLCRKVISIYHQYHLFISYIILYNTNETRTLIVIVNSTTLLSMTRDKVGDIGKNDAITLNKYGIIAFWERSSVSPLSVVCLTKERLVPCFNVFGMTRSSNTRRHHSTTSLSRHWHSLQPSC